MRGVAHIFMSTSRGDAESIMKFKDRLIRFFQGRNGTDDLARAASWAALVFVILSTVLAKASPALSSILWGVSIAGIIYSFFRMFSKNVNKRRAENWKFVAWKQKIKRWFAARKQRIKDHKTHCYFRCPKCKTRMRVPRGKGRVQVTCKTCGEKFIKKT